MGLFIVTDTANTKEMTLWWFSIVLFTVATRRLLICHRCSSYSGSSYGSCGTDKNLDIFTILLSEPAFSFYNGGNTAVLDFGFSKFNIVYKTLDMEKLSLSLSYERLTSYFFNTLAASLLLKIGSTIHRPLLVGTAALAAVI